jgi:hypothetical protein
MCVLLLLSFLGSSCPLPLEVLIQVVKHCAGAFEPHLIFFVSYGDAGHKLLESERVFPSELIVLEIDVADDLGDGNNASIS